MDFLLWLEQTGVARWVRESPSLAAFPTVLFTHTLGMAVVAGLSGAMDLRILGVGREIALSHAAKLFRLIWIGFAFSSVSGVLLLMAGASTKLISPVFYVKMIFLLFAMLDLLAIRQKVFRDPLVDKVPVSSVGKFLAIASLIFWIGTITAGRLMAYL
jgi:hypothetical protein